MLGTGKKGNAAKKAYEIAYALFRVSAKIAESSVKEKLESEAINLLISANAEDYGNAAKTVAVIDALVKFSVDLNIVSISNGDVLLREIGAMNEAIIECLDKSDDVDVSKFFSKTKETVVHDVTPASARIPVVPAKASLSSQHAPLSSPHASLSSPRRRGSSSFVAPPRGISVVPAPYRSTGQAPAGIQERNSPLAPPRGISVVPAKAGIQDDFSSKRTGNLDPVLQRDDSAVSPQSGNPANVVKSGNRQIAILDRIRQSGNCKLKEIQEILPDCSERTIRYDLEELIERNLVERIGSGGPAVSYRVRQLA